MQTQLLSEERIIKEGLANLQKGAETVGGKLCMSNLRVIFEPHVINVQTSNVIFDVNKIVSVKPCWTKFLNIFPLLNNSIAVQTDTLEYKFVINNRNTWIEEIQRLIPSLMK